MPCAPHDPALNTHDALQEKRVVVMRRGAAILTKKDTQDEEGDGSRPASRLSDKV